MIKSRRKTSDKTMTSSGRPSVVRITTEEPNHHALKIELVTIARSKPSIHSDAVRLVKDSDKRSSLPPLSPAGPLVKPRRQRNVHYDYLAASAYCAKHGKELKDLTPEELQLFQIQAQVVARPRTSH